MCNVKRTLFITKKEKIFFWILDGLRRLKKTRENIAEAVAENYNIVIFIMETESASEGLRRFLLIDGNGVLAYIWLCNAEYRQQQRVQRAYKGV